jgi:hypothetical protein
MLCNEVLKGPLTVEQLDAIIDQLPADPHDYKDPSITWKKSNGH